MDDISEEIRRVAIEHDAYSPEQIVHILRSSITDIKQVGETVKNMKADPDTYGGLFLTRIPSTALKAKPL
jgi:hypothetical protein